MFDMQLYPSFVGYAADVFGIMGFIAFVFGHFMVGAVSGKRSEQSMAPAEEIHSSDLYASFGVHRAS